MNIFIRIARKSLFIILLITFLIPQSMQAITLSDALKQIKNLTSEVSKLKSRLGAQALPTTEVCTVNSFTATPSTVKVGEKTTLSWSTSNCSKIDIEYGLATLATSLPATGSISTEVLNQTTLFSLVADGQYLKNMDVVVEHNGVCTENTPGWIKVLSPNGGETYQENNEITIKWDSCNIQGEVYIALEFSYKNDGFAFSPGVFPNNGSAVVKLSGFPFENNYGKNFKVLIDQGKGDPYGARDKSDTTFTIGYSSDSTPRIAYWWGRVNQHVDANGNWMTDPDGTSGANLDKLTYCKKWYPNTIRVESYKTETIEGFKDAGNRNNYTGTMMTDKCVQKRVVIIAPVIKPLLKPTITVVSPNGGEVYKPGEKITVTWKSTNIPASNNLIAILLKHYDNNGAEIHGQGLAVFTDNDGQETITLPSELPPVSGVDWGKRFKISVGATDTNNPTQGLALDHSDNLFTIQKQDPDACNANQMTTIDVISPNGGEVYEEGQEIVVKWKSCNIPAGSVVFANLINNESGKSVQIYPKNEITNAALSGLTENDGEDIFTIPLGRSLQNDNFYGYGKKFTIQLVVKSTFSGGLPGGAYTIANDQSDNLFTIEKVEPICVINSFTANPSSINPGETSTLTWSTTGCGHVTIYTGSGINEPQSRSGSKIVGPLTVTTDYTLNAIAPGMRDPAAKGVTVIVHENKDLTPRIAYWWGRVNQHVDANGNWMTDPDGTSGANLDKLTYCKKWYPNTIRVESYKTETIEGFKDAGNRNDYTGTMVTDKCVQGIVVDPVEPSGTEKIFLMGGNDNHIWAPTNDVWESADGVNWTQKTANAEWSKRYGLNSVFFNNKLWVIGGFDGNVKNDVWSSYDGVTWSKIVDNAPWKPRGWHTSLIFNNEIYIIGGFTDLNTGNQINDVWSSPDGITWKLKTNNAPWSARGKHVSVVFDNKLWIIGGSSFESGEINDVWSSPDGITWNKVVDSAPWEPRGSHTGIVYKDKIFIMGGVAPSVSSVYKNDVWSSKDGKTWEKIKGSVEWSKRYGHELTVLNNSLVIMGGVEFYDFPNDKTINDVWSSMNGNNWTQKTASALWSPRNFFTVSNTTSDFGKRMVNNNSNSATNSSALNYSTSIFNRSLKLGSEGEDVKALQTRLKSEGVYTGAATGYFGPMTQASLKRFQLKYRLAPVGQVGPQTIILLNK